jgi:hypothetical protein
MFEPSAHKSLTDREGSFGDGRIGHESAKSIGNWAVTKVVGHSLNRRTSTARKPAFRA